MTKAQNDLLEEFYSLPFSKAVYPKNQRDQVWKEFRDGRNSVDSSIFLNTCPALAHEMQKAISSGRNLQSAVFSECVYAQTLANHFELRQFTDAPIESGWLSSPILALLDSYNLSARYLYRNHDRSRLLIQAGGHAGVDSALLSVYELNVFTIEFKEPGAKTSEPDLPPYEEDGFLATNPEWESENPQFISMIEEQKNRGLNFFDVAGSNINDFSKESIQQAVSDNYSAKKFADVICTEDTDGFLTMIPSNQIHLWAKLKGEIRPAGRNAYSVWTPRHLEETVLRLGGAIDREMVSIPADRLVAAKQRGRDLVSRYKISPLYFVRIGDIQRRDDMVHFVLGRVRQLRPTISAHMFFRGLSVEQVKDYYLHEGAN